MTASLPPQRRREMEECGLTIFPQELDRFDDLRVKANTNRYRVSCLDGGKEEAFSLAWQQKEKGKRVLWVVNTVDRCQELARNLSAICYHSRLRLKDRKKKHDEVVQAFKKGNRSLIAVTTQVCEMSLDLDADVLISEIAPITSLIQRMGRCNRHQARSVGFVFFYRPENEMPYKRDDLRGVDAFLSEMNGKNVSQRDLDELLNQYGTNEREVEKYSAFLQDGPWAEAREGVAEYNERTVQAILDCDISDYLRRKKDKGNVDGLFLPVPLHPSGLATRSPFLRAFPLVAPATHYSQEFGFFKYPLQEII